MSAERPAEEPSGFDDLPVEALNDLAGRVTLHSAAKQATVIRAGDRADAFYVAVRTITPGKVFLLERTEPTRAARGSDLHPERRNKPDTGEASGLLTVDAELI